MTVKTSNPQPQAVERINNQKADKNSNNLNGNEMHKSPKEKDEMVKQRNENNNEEE